MGTSTVDGRIGATRPGGFTLVLRDGSWRHYNMADGAAAPYGIGAHVEVRASTTVEADDHGASIRYVPWSISLLCGRCSRPGTRWHRPSCQYLCAEHLARETEHPAGLSL